MPRIIEKPSAAQDVERIISKISENRPRVALRFSEAVWKTYQWLSLMPEGGAIVDGLQSTQHAGMRTCRVKQFKNYLVLYLPLSDGVVIHQVVDGRRDYLQTLFGSDE